METLATLSLLVNFVLVPVVGYLITLILLATGAPFLSMVAEITKGNLAFPVGIMVLLMVATIIYLTIVLPFAGVLGKHAKKVS